MDERRRRLPGRSGRRRGRWGHSTIVVIVNTVIVIVVVTAVYHRDIAVVKDDEFFLGHPLSLLLRPANALELHVGVSGDEAAVLHVELERGRVVEDRAAVGDAIPAHRQPGRRDLRVFGFVDHPGVNRDGGKRERRRGARSPAR